MNVFNDSFDKLNQELEASIANADLQGEIETRGGKAAKHLMKLQFKQAAAELGKVANLVLEKGQVENAATAKFAQAKATAQLDDGIVSAIVLCGEALRLAQRTNNWQLLTEIGLFLTELFIVEENFPAALQSISEVLGVYAAESASADKVIFAYRLRGGIGVFVLLYEQAKQDFDIALSLADQLGDIALSEQIQTQRDLVDIFEQGDLTLDDLLSIFVTLNVGQNNQIGADPDLLKALEKLGQKKNIAARNLAQKSLDAARADQDPAGYIRYLLASLVLAEIHDAADEKVDVLKVLLRCKVYIEQSFTPAAGQQIDQYLNSFQERWGAETLQQTILEYQTWVAENGPIQA